MSEQKSVILDAIINFITECSLREADKYVALTRGPLITEKQIFVSDGA